MPACSSKGSVIPSLFKFPPTGGVNVIKLRNGIFSNPLFCLQKRVVERSNDRVSKLCERHYRLCISVNAWRVDSPRLRYAGRPSLRQAGKRVKKENSLNYEIPGGVQPPVCKRQAHRAPLEEGFSQRFTLSLRSKYIIE
jgi:hypothetical protein